MFRRLCHVDGAWLAANGFTFAMTNPANGSLLGSVPNAGACPAERVPRHPRAVAMANDIEFRLASYFYVRDIGRIWRVALAH